MGQEDKEDEGGRKEGKDGIDGKVKSGEDEVLRKTSWDGWFVVVVMPSIKDGNVRLGGKQQQIGTGRPLEAERDELEEVRVTEGKKEGKEGGGQRRSEVDDNRRPFCPATPPSSSP
ncbi:hypothetical protein GPALN_012930 [Globodera pallida]|nr:hypothetical protein GPALN_012930 [Globodera pallida]